MMSASIQVVDNQVICQGEWTLTGIVALQKTAADLILPSQEAFAINCEHISQMDTAGAWFLQCLTKQWQAQGKQTYYMAFAERYQPFLVLLQQHTKKVEEAEILPPPRENMLVLIGKAVMERCQSFLSFSSFLGELVVVGLQTLTFKRHFQWRTFIKAIDEAGYQALPIIGLLSFLIGVVLSYQMGIEFRLYGASIYVVNVTGLAILREFGPLITAIIAAGRTSSALTAKIGTMIVNDEIDALRTMGFTPLSRLVLPKVVAVVIALPLLTVWANIFGVLGSMVMSRGILDISYQHFLEHFHDVVKIKNYWVGLSKAPVFGFIVAAVGCYRGLQVTAKAESVGWQTTKSVVQAIFLIIIADALFSVLFSWWDI